MLLLLLAALVLAAAERNRLLRVPAWVDDANGQFSAKVDGRPATVVAARGPADDLVLLLVLDLTADLALADIAKDALSAALEQLPATVHVGLMRAQDGLRVLKDPTTDRAALAEAIRALPVSGKAGLLDTVETAERVADAVLAKAAVRVAVVYLTDSDVRNYREDFINPVINSSDSHDMSRRFPEGLVREKISKLERKLAAFEAPLFVIHLAYRSDRLNEAYQAGVKQLASTAGGASVFCRSRSEIPEAIASTLRSVSSHYSLVLRLPEHPARNLQVEVENSGRPVTYRNRFTVEGK